MAEMDGSAQEARNEKGGWKMNSVNLDRNRRYPIRHLVSQPVTITDFYTDRLISIPKEYEVADDDAALHQAEEMMQLDLGISADHMKSLREDCGVSSLTCEKEQVVLDNILALHPPDGMGLETLIRYRKSTTNEFGLAARDAPTSRRVNFLPNDLTYLNSREQGSTDLVGSSYLKDVLLTVLIMKPLRRASLGKNKHHMCKTMQRLEVLGSQTLADLKDRICCRQDDAILGDCSDCLGNVPSEVVAKEIYPSCYFFIEGAFYSDLRYPNQQDLTRPVIDWISASSERRAKYGSPSSHRMDDVHFRELTIRIGEPFLYVHQGDCEHIVVFSDLRLVGPHDCQDPMRYPLLTGYLMERGRSCKVCQREQAKWGVLGSDLLPEEPCFLCETCLRMLLYDSDGRKKSDDFRVFALSRTNPAL